MVSTKERIIEAALSLASQHGLTEITMVDIARTAGVARQTLYNHYTDIPSILTDAAARHNEAAVNQLDQALAVVDTPSETIRQLVRHVAAISAHPGHSLDHFHRLPPELQHQFDGFDAALERHLRRTLAAGVREGEFRPDLVVETDAALIRYLLNGLSALVAAEPTEAPRITAEVTRTALAALKRDSGS